MTWIFTAIVHAVSVRWIAWLDASHRRAAAQFNLRQHDACFRAAERIYAIGFHNEPDIQAHLSRAKDELYQAAIRFEAEAGKASNG